MRQRNVRRAAIRWLGATVVVALAACTQGGRDEYSKDGDTGAAAPAASPDQSTAKMIGPDSALGTGGRTGEPGVAGDTTGSRGAPAGSSDSATRARVDSAARRAQSPPPA